MPVLKCQILKAGVKMTSLVELQLLLLQTTICKKQTNKQKPIHRKNVNQQ